MKLKEKAKWLQEHYGQYSLSWYLSDQNRLETIFEREYNKYLDRLNKETLQDKIAEINIQLEKMQKAYMEYYKTDFQTDFKTNRFETMRKAQAISNLWLDAVIA